MLPPAAWRNRIIGYGEEAPDQLLANDKNWRIHPKTQQDALSGVLREVGVVQNIIVNQRTQKVVDGHLRVALAISANQPTVPVTYVDLDEAEEAKILATIDPLSAMAATDAELLTALLSEVQTGDAALQSLLDNLAGTANVVPAVGLTDEDAAPSTPEAPVSAQGDLWLLGGHRLLCGDSTSIEAVDRLMDGEKADMVFTDPPYGIALIKQQRGRVGGGTRQYPTREFNQIIGDSEPFDPQCLFGYSDQMVVWGGNYFADRLPPSRCWFVWDKKHPIDRTFCGCELAWTTLDRHAKVYESAWDGWTKEGESGSKVHPSQKPIKLCADILSETTEDGALVLDLFGGSGSTLIACEKIKRNARLMELDPKYCDVIVKRWQDFTGKQAMLDGDTRTFDEIANERTAAMPVRDCKAPSAPAVGEQRH